MSAPTLEPRDAAAFFEEVSALLPGWVPELRPQPGDPSYALLQVLARYLQTIGDRLNQAPDKNLLAFLDQLGLSLIPALPARAPVVFQPVPNAADAQVPARTRLGAKVAGQSEPVIFETERASGLAAARLVEVVSVWPARDHYTDHSTDVAGRRAFTLFGSASPLPHEFYLAHDTLLAFASGARVEIEFDLATPGNQALAIAWEYWDGEVWRPFREFDPADKDASSDSTEGLTRSGIISLRAECGKADKTTVYGLKAYWIRGRLEKPLPPDPGRVLPLVDRIRLRTVQTASLLTGEAAFADGLKVDLSKSFFPFDQQPKPGSAFYFRNDAAFGKPGAEVTFVSLFARTQFFETASGTTGGTPPTVVLEYWNGRSWASISPLSGNPRTVISGSGFFGASLKFLVPPDITRAEVNNQEGFWVRFRISSGTFMRTRKLTFSGNEILIGEVVPPALSFLVVGYTYRSAWVYPEQCLTYNDFQWAAHTRDARWPGNFFSAFSPSADALPALYFGFDRPLPNDSIGLYLDIAETDDSPPSLVWEGWDGAAWKEVTASDGTAGLRRPGVVALVPPAVSARPEAAIRSVAGARVVTGGPLDAARFAPGDLVVLRKDQNAEVRRVDSVEAEAVLLDAPPEKDYAAGVAARASLARFGASRDWIRVRLKQDGRPPESRVGAVFLNAVWAVQVETVSDEVLGASLGIPGQSLRFRKNPVLPGEQVEVRELEGPRAAVELPILQRELLAQGFREDDIRTVPDPRTGRVREVWVRWQSRPHFYFSGPGDRHYVVERASGRLLFGDGRRGLVPPVGSGNVRARVYQAGGGLAGNVPEGAITQLLSGVLAQGVTNPRAAEGGADGETPGLVRWRGPLSLRHLGRSVSAGDCEALAREASPAVAAARVLPATAPNGRPAPGWLTVVIVPQSHDPQPQPSFGLRQQVHDYLVGRAPATLDPERLAVIGPTYLPIGASALVIPRDTAEAGVVRRRVESAVGAFLHPLTGGPDGRGWPFGRSVYLSDLAAVVEALAGVDHVEELQLLVGDAPAGESVAVPPDRIVVAGPLRIEVRGE